MRRPIRKGQRKVQNIQGPGNICAAPSDAGEDGKTGG